MDTELGKLVIEQGLATPSEVEQCLNVKAQAEDPNQQSLAQILITNKIVTARQIDRVKEKILEVSKGQQIPGYKIISKLGSGAMATVFKAKQLSLDRYVAIKVLPRRLSENAEYVERFYKEGKAAAKLNHTGIVQAFDVGEAGGYHYFVMEYVKGHTLYDEIAGGKVFTEKDALDVIVQIARAMEHAHEQGLIHRDVKPKNIMMTEDGTAKLADMGLAREASDVAAAEAEAGRAYGTPYYISPEQIRGEVNVDFRADIYSLGATLYHMVTGRVPFEGPTPAAVMHKHLKDPLVPPDHINTKLSAGLGEVVEVMMAKDREQRYDSTTDLLIDLESIAVGESPLIARKHINENVLQGLADFEEEPEALQESSAINPETLPVYFIFLIALLVISIVLNILLFIKLQS